jgi:uncharacterized protein DUF5667
MPRPGPEKLHDDLDALLDGRPVELTGELAPLAEAAGALRAELDALQLDPEVADRHLELVLRQGPGRVVAMPVRTPLNGWDLRRRVAAVVLAAALVLAPATMASAAALPGQAMYPFKRAIEQLRLVAVGWSPSGEAAERTRVAEERLDELEQLTDLGWYARLPTAIEALEEAVVAAKVAVREAQQEGAAVSGVAATLAKVNNEGVQALEEVAEEVSAALLPADTRAAIQQAVQESREVLVVVPVPDQQASGTKPPPTTAGPAATQPSASTRPPDPTQVSGPTPTMPPPTQPPVTAPPTTAPPTTVTTTAPPTTAGPQPTSPPASGEQPGADGRTIEQASEPPEPTVLGS